MRQELRENCDANEPDRTRGGNASYNGRTSDCADADDMDRIRAEYRANNIGAREQHVGQRMCLRGAISRFTDGGVIATIGGRSLLGPATFYVGHSQGSGAGDLWVMSKSLGDTIEAEWEGQYPSWLDG